MNFLIALAVIATCFALMAIGLIIKKKALTKGCGLAPEDCACEQENKDPAKCDNDPAQKQT